MADNGWQPSKAFTIHMVPSNVISGLNLNLWNSMKYHTILLSPMQLFWMDIGFYEIFAFMLVTAWGTNNAWNCKQEWPPGKQNKVAPDTEAVLQ